MITKANTGHPGGSLSCTDILVALYKKILKHNPKQPRDPDRDRFILSKGHAAPALYAMLTAEGYAETSVLETFRQFGSPLQGHPKRWAIPGIEVTTGSLGQGASIAVGCALSMQLDKTKGRTYALLGDGECNEGVVWEAAMAAAHYNLDNLIFIVDRNAIQLDGPTEKIMGVEPFAAKWDAFGWHVIEVDGTSIKELLMALNTAKQLRGKPVIIIAYMIKGQGVSFMQHIAAFHGKPPTEEEYQTALNDLENYEQFLINRIST